MIKLILVVFVLIALAGGTFTGLTAFGVVPDVLGLGLTFAGSTARSADKPPPPPVRPEYVEIEPFVLPVILEGQGLHRSIYFNFRLKVHKGHGIRCAPARRAHPGCHVSVSPPLDSFMATGS